MTLKAAVLTVLVVFALAVPGVVGSGFAEPLPGYFEDEWVGFVCLTASPPGSPPTSVLVQFMFDKTSNGGISLTWADSLFAFLTGNLGLLSPIIGSNPQTACSRTPSQIQVEFPGATGLQAAQLVSGSFQQLGFSRYIIVDTYLSFLDLSYGETQISVETLNSDVFRVNGNNDVSPVAANQIARSLVP
jgi:hypothetical protein